LRQIRKYQKESSECLIIPKAAFARIVKEIGQDYRDNNLYSKKAIITLQYYLEQKMVERLENANLCALHSGRTRVKPKDIQLTRRIIKERE
jgi:histone H3